MHIACSAAMSVNQVRHRLTLKVIRLAKPTLSTTLTPEDGHLPVEDSCGRLEGEDPSTMRGADMLMVGEMLPLPQTCGNVSLGETLSTSISVCNHSDQTVRDVLLKADLQTSSRRLSISLSNSTVAELPPECCMGDVLHHEIKDLEPHVLACTVGYTTRHEGALFFRRFFKFNVLKPLNVETWFHSTETDEVFLEAHVQNFTSSPVFLEGACLEPSFMYTVTELNTVSCGDQESASVFGKLPIMQPMDTWQYLYRLQPRTEHAEEAGAVRGATVMGRLDITWSMDLGGERKRLQSAQLRRVVPWYRDVRLSVEMIPDTVNLEEPFQLICEITNRSGRKVDLVLDTCNSPSTHWCCVSGRQLGALCPAASLFLTLTLLCTAQGLQTIAGLRLTDRLQRRIYRYDDIAQVYVVRPYTSNDCERLIDL